MDFDPQTNAEKLFVIQPDEMRAMLKNGLKQAFGNDTLDEAELEEAVDRLEKWLRKTACFE